MRTSGHRKHYGARPARRTHATAGLTALGSVAVLVTLVLTCAGSLLTPSNASPGLTVRYPRKTVTATKTVHDTKTVTATATATATTTATATVTVAGPTATATVTATETLFAPTSSATAATEAPSSTASAAPLITPLSDFRQQSAGLYLGSGQLVGNGVDQSVYLLPAHTSTATDPSSGTNQLVLMRAGGMSSSEASTVELGGFTLQGTDQSPTLDAYGGMQLGYGTGSLIHDVKITGIPGYSASPPGETFALELWRSNSATLRNVVLDGNRTSDGAGVGASLLAYSYTSGNHTITNLTATHARYGFGVAMYEASGSYTFDGGCDLSDNRKAINIEESIGATYNFNGCDFRGTTGAPYVAQVSSINASSKVYFRDPVVDSWPLKVNCYGPEALGGANKQLDSDIHLIIHGVDVSNDPTKLQITHL